MFFLDVQGTLLSDKDKSLIEGAKQLIEHLNLKKLPYVIITNNTKKLDFLQILRQKELAIKENAYIDPFFVLSTLMRKLFKAKPYENIAAFGSEPFLQSLENLGFKLDFQSPQALLIASWDGFNFKDFAKMIELAKKGVKVIAMHETSIYKKDGLSYPGVGAIMHMLKYACDLKYEVVGKPSLAFYKEALNLLKKQDERAEFKDITIISDDYKGDLIEAKRLGMKTKLVLSGKLSSSDGLDKSFLDGVYPSVLQILKELECLK
ncbi:HAD family hydrolase [Campylobacter sp. MIT 99-7217]|uniref:HAD-IIA family hydrolase n=1 Tax=Campylobacter sp. MIT 99-7217 TaxID=535091 RepID=UPI0011583E46|nr:HAD-IIA family hydrolase [Campylobacter sp. MIT 99-7217]TQR30633.1 HAD family hydrolase [Campylobacter sp. MIT 99-7217]